MHNAAMCGRFTLTIAERQMIAEMLGVDPDSIQEDYRPRYNIAPTDPHFVITTQYETRRASPVRWGLVNSWARDNSRAAACINAKAETIDTRGAFGDAFVHRRCVVTELHRRPVKLRSRATAREASRSLILSRCIHKSTS